MEEILGEVIHRSEVRTKAGFIWRAASSQPRYFAGKDGSPTRVGPLVLSSEPQNVDFDFASRHRKPGRAPKAQFLDLCALLEVPSRPPCPGGKRGYPAAKEGNGVGSGGGRSPPSALSR